MNITDVDDKTILRSITNNIKITDWTNKYINLFFNLLKTLKIIPADVYPKATEHVDIMIDMVQKLFDNGFAYQSEDKSIYFNITKFNEYGKLAKLNIAEQKSADRIAVMIIPKITHRILFCGKPGKKRMEMCFGNHLGGKEGRLAY